jgi:hypothetical protein
MLQLQRVDTVAAGRMPAKLTSSPFDQYYLLDDTIFVMADHPAAAETIRKCPQLPAVNGVALELICELMHGKATAEAKVELLKKAIEAL